MAWAEVGSGSQRATKNAVTASSTTLAFPGSVAKGNLLIVAGSAGKQLSQSGDRDLVVTDTVGTAYTVVDTLDDAFFSSTFRRFIAYGFAAGSGANTVTVGNETGRTVELTFSIDEFSGIHRTNPIVDTTSIFPPEDPLTLSLAGGTLEWTGSSSFVHAGSVGIAFRPASTGLALIVGLLSVYSVNAAVVVISADSPATTIGSYDGGGSNTANHFAAFTSGGPAGSATYEDPCAIEDPRIFTVIRTEDDTLKFGIHPLRDPAELGGFRA